MLDTAYDLNDAAHSILSDHFICFGTGWQQDKIKVEPLDRSRLLRNMLRVVGRWGWGVGAVEQLRTYSRCIRNILKSKLDLGHLSLDVILFCAAN